MEIRVLQYPVLDYANIEEEAKGLEYKYSIYDYENDPVSSFSFYCPVCKSTHNFSYFTVIGGIVYSLTYRDFKDIHASGTVWPSSGYKNDEGVYCSEITLANIEGLYGDNTITLHAICHSLDPRHKKYDYFAILCPNTNERVEYVKGTVKPPVLDKPEVDIPDEPDIENPNTNAMPPVLQEMRDLEVYQGEKFLMQFYAYDIDGYIKDFYFTSSGGQGWGRFTPQYIGNSVYANLFLFGDLGEYNCRIKVVDNDGLETESNDFVIKVIPPLSSFEPPKPPNVSNSEHIILYDKNSDEFESNGLGILKDCISCTVENELNGVCELVLCYPVNTKFDDYLLDTEHIIKCNVDNNANSQLFRIYDSEYIMHDNRIIVRGRHITYDLKDDFVEGVSVLHTSCENATQAIISNSKGNSRNRFLVYSNIDTRRKFSITRTNTLEALIGTEGSIFDIYGDSNTMIIRDNFNLGIENKEVDRGVNISYSKNMIGFSRRVNIENVITKIYPYTITRYGKVIRLKEKFIVSPNSSRYSIEKIKAIEFRDDNILKEEDLRNASKNYFAENNIDIPAINYYVDFVLLYKNNENMASLETVSLGDLVTINDSKIGLSVKAKVIKTIYNSISNKYEKIELGNFKNEYRHIKKNEQNNIRLIARGVMN